MGSVSVYGISTEGYLLASRMAKGGYQVNLIDERWGICMSLKPELMLKSAAELITEDSLLGLKSLEETVSESDVLFIAPKVKGDDEIEGIGAKVKHLFKYLKKGSTVVINLPLSYNGNAMLVRLVEKMSGLSKDEFTYLYMPLAAGRAEPTSIGFYGNERGLRPLLKALGLRERARGLNTSELEHFSWVMSAYKDVLPSVELCRRVDRGERKRVSRDEIYLDDMFRYAIDLRLMLRSFRTGDPMLYWANSVLKSLDGYVKFLVEEVKRAVKESEWKASKTKVFLTWSLDGYEIRGFGSTVREQLAERLRDYLGEVLVMEGGAIPLRDSLVLHPDKHVIIVACSKADFETVAKLKRGGAKVLKANTRAELV